MASRIARKIVKSVLSREQMDGDGARGMYSSRVVVYMMCVYSS